MSGMAITGTPRRITLEDGRPAFRKELADAPPEFFAREAVGLRALAEAGARVPAVLDLAADHITLEWVEQGTARSAMTEERFGQELAALHRTTGEAYGSTDGESTAYMGACPIDLTPTETWWESWVERRLVPLVRRGVERGVLDPDSLERAERITPERLGPVEPPTLVHGDLWGGNRLIDTKGHDWLIDPCAHYGHREVDLAMMQLFGGFSGRVYAAYAEAFPLADGWQERVAVYQTVPLVVHSLLFGGGYDLEATSMLVAATR